MRPHILIIVLTSSCYFTAESKVCNKYAVTTYLKRPLYEFSVKILDRVTQETGGHFVFSPVYSWLQLVNIAEGAERLTLNELRNVTGRYWKRCMRRILRVILNRENNQTKIRSKSLVIVDRLLRVKKPFKKRLELLKTVKVESLDFDAADASSDKVNEILSNATEGDILNAVDPDDFNQTLLLMSDAISFTNAWLKPFISAHTKNEIFYHGTTPIGEVNMMTQTEHFNYVKIDKINAEILELPCIDENHSMLIFLPTEGRIIDLFYDFKRIRLANIFNMFKKSGDAPLVNVRVPRFEIMTDVINLPELLSDMGVTRIFDPNQADLKGISEYSINVSIMRQKARIRVTEEGVNAVAEPTISNEVSIDFVANRPFGFMLVQKSTEIPLFAGIYLWPSVY
ncbi:serine protease inhibitor 77Ba-like [Choristoneura fumiferana]|uniref:serine protease inhibitor 77Ba-like n=1 Tax=Choristoneura fumiferana TaxID=7141 RepID=UPI003D15E859